VNNEIKNIYRDLLDFLKSNNKKHPKFEMDAFAALEGKKYNKELLVVGRAVNGWSEAIDFNKSTDDLLKEIFDRPTDKCPMSWVTNQWGPNKNNANGDEYYNTAKSAFLRTIKGVVTDSKLNIAPAADDWASYIAWSNLYKISKHGSGNPPEWLRKKQFDYCVKLFMAEVNYLRPKRILFLTGLISWAEPFMNRVNFEKDNPPFPNSKYIETSGIIHLEGLQDSPRVIIAPHPQGKPERIIIEDVLRCFS
jgi:hypothetical protein